MSKKLEELEVGDIIFVNYGGWEKAVIVAIGDKVFFELKFPHNGIYGNLREREWFYLGEGFMKKIKRFFYGKCIRN